MYVNPNFKTKKELKEALAKGKFVDVYAPGLGLPRAAQVVRNRDNGEWKAD